jgi:hypothetical protein
MPAHPANTEASTGRRCRAGRARSGGLRVGERYLTQVQAARAAGVSRDTIIRARRAGRLAACRLVDGRWLIPASSLAASGLGTGPGDEGDSMSSQPGPDPEDGEGLGLAAAQARISALTEVVGRQDEELRFLRQLLAEALSKRGTG